MKKILPFLFVLAIFAAPASAQESYNTAATAGQVATLRAIVAARNNDVCQAYALSIGCTQAQACVAANVVGGASCTAAAANAANVRIFADTLAGREEFNFERIEKPAFIALKAAMAGSNIATYCNRFAGLPQTGTDSKDTELTRFGLPTGSTSCPLQ